MSRPSILVVDDDEDLRETLASCLDAEGFETATAEDGVAATASMAQKGFDLVISDVRMPKMGGMELLSRARANGGPPVVLMTGYADIPASEAMARGAKGFVQKPFSLEALCEIVRRLLGRTR